jgi:hypothetical protein
MGSGEQETASEETQKTKVKEAAMTDRKRGFFWIIFWSALIIAFIFGASLVKASENQTENQSGKAYGSAVYRDTAYATWDDKSYIDLEPFKTGIDLNFKVLITAADTLIFRFRGSNAKPDSLTYYDVIKTDTLRLAAMGDSIIHETFPQGTTSPLTVLPKYLKVEIILADTTGGAAATATISDSWIAR